MDLDFVETYGAIFAAIFGGVGVKIIDRIMSKRSEMFLESAKLRDELRIEIATLRKDCQTAEKEADDWRQKYYTKQEEAIAFRAEVEALRHESELLKKSIDTDSSLIDPVA